MNNRPVRPKKQLGQHFLTDLSIAQQIAALPTGHNGYGQLIEIGPGTGVLTQYILKRPEFSLKAVEIDRESAVFLQESGMLNDEQLMKADFLKLSLPELFEEKIGIVGNFPYNISSQIFFKVLENRHQVQELVGMVQKEVAERIASPSGNKVSGILSVLTQAFYDVKYEFTVPPHVFDPPPKVQSAVISMKRNAVEKLDCNEVLFFKVVKQGFNTRRKTLRNALKPLGMSVENVPSAMLDLRAEQLGVAGFVELTRCLEVGL